jgi:hypothetical protein
MARLPKVNGDEHNWGALLNEFLQVAHREDGGLRGICPVVNVRDFGAKGDGVTDDSNAIQRAANFAADPTATSHTLCFPPGTYLLKSPSQLPDNVTLHFQNGAMLHIADAVTLTIPGPVEAGLWPIFLFSGSGKVKWGSVKQALEQAWFGSDERALHKAVEALSAGRRWHLCGLESGFYTLQTRLDLPYGVEMFGDGAERTLIEADVDGDGAIYVDDDGGLLGTNAVNATMLRDFKVFGKHGENSGSRTTGGIWLYNVGYTKISNVISEFFTTEVFSSPGPLASNGQETQLRAGFRLSGVVNVELDNCVSRFNDVGFYVDNGNQSISTTVYANRCSFRDNRTHAIKIHRASKVVFNQGVIEANLGHRTVKVTDEPSYPSTDIEFRSLWFEANQYALTKQTPGTREVLVEVAIENEAAIAFHDVVFNPSHPRPDKGVADIPIELSGTRGTLFVGGSVGVGAMRAQGPNEPIRIHGSCRDTTIIGTELPRHIDDRGTGTTIIGANGLALVLNDAKFLPDNSVSPTALGSYFVLPPFTITDLQGQPGQMVLLESQQGSILNGPNFALENGDSQLVLAGGSTLLLRKHRMSGKWVLLAHQTPTAPGTFGAGATVYIDDRKVYMLNATPTDTISTILNGYDGHEITIVGNQTGGVTRTFISGSGNLDLSAASIVVGRGDVLKLVYLKSMGRWHQCSYSHNA